jgi:hypothetical protein
MQPNKRIKRSRCSTKATASSIFQGFTTSAGPTQNQERQSTPVTTSTDYLLQNDFEPNEWESTFHEDLIEAFDELNFGGIHGENDYQQSEEEQSEDEVSEETDFDYENTGKKKKIFILHMLTLFFFFFTF